MLASLTIKNVVLIDQLTIDFASGLSALTGETGAGKSILLDSLGLALGARADAGLVRYGTDQAVVSASFELSDDHPVQYILRDQDIDFDPNLILRRSVSKEGRSKAFINDQAVSVNLLKLVGEMLVEIHGQFDTQDLLNPQQHLTMLDDYAAHAQDLEKLSSAWDVWKESAAKLINLRAKMDKARADEDYLRASLEDLDALSPERGEEEKLSNLRDRLMRREQILENLQTAQNGLDEIETISSNVWRLLDKLGEEGKNAVAAMDRTNSEIQEVIAALQDISSEIENSEYSLTEIDDRLFALKAQARKHGCAIDDLSQKREDITEALNAIEGEDGILSTLMRDVKKHKANYIALAQKISTARQKAGAKLAKLVMQELPPLKLEKARFEVRFDILSEENYTIRGLDKVQFLVATNPGAEAGALNKIASGGELARLMLALKVVLAEVGTAGTLVFDEVDSGIGGATAAAVGERLARLSTHRQILVVTHSPQVAAMAENHWIVMKQGDKTVTTNIIPLSDAAERKEEIARMLSGAEVTIEARAAAAKLLEACYIKKSAA